ncbi:MAG: hypothetical protein HY682_09005 [Chloroflexi bacterium]|nr:hypothetical protein [Chloroflexota bacterium]
MPGRRFARFATISVVVVLTLVALIFPRGDRVILSAVEEAAAEHRFSLVGWEIRNAISKWLNRTVHLWRGVPEADGRVLLDRYSALTGQVRDLEGRIEKLAAERTGGEPDSEILTLEAGLKELKAERAALRHGLEEFLESEISKTIDGAGLGAVGDFLWPPVDFRMDSPPQILVTSPRERIQRLEDVLLKSNTLVTDAEKLEQELFEGQNLSAIVDNLGGLATYPNIVSEDYDLLPLLEVAAHEWMHSNFFFYPLGQNFDASPEMQTLNETLADLAGQEIGRATWSRLTGQPAREPDLLKGPPEPAAPGEFAFPSFMRETRLRVEQLLSEKKIEEAEAYMEQRRRELQEHKVFIRKLNQAYLAFHGTYADSPASISPIGPEMAEYRRLSRSIGDVVRELRGVGNYEEFQARLTAKRAAAGAPPS